MKRLLLILSIALVMFTSCKKDKVDSGCPVITSMERACICVPSIPPVYTNYYIITSAGRFEVDEHKYNSKHVGDTFCNP